MIILPSIASANQADLATEIERLQGHPYLHFDVEDGNFVPNLTFGVKTIRALRPLSTAAFDAHLMVTNPLDYIPALCALKFRAIAFHWESAPYPLRLIHAIQSGGCYAGIALNPRTAAQQLQPYLAAADYVLVMTSECDGKGDQFQLAMLEKIRWLRAAAPGLNLVADGGIDRSNLPAVITAGVDAVVMGRAVFGADDPAVVVRAFEAFN